MTPRPPEGHLPPAEADIPVLTERLGLPALDLDTRLPDGTAAAAGGAIDQAGAPTVTMATGTAPTATTRTTDPATPAAAQTVWPEPVWEAQLAANDPLLRAELRRLLQAQLQERLTLAVQATLASIDLDALIEQALRARRAGGPPWKNET
jgi:hypothetical protein